MSTQFIGPAEEWFTILKNLNIGSLIFEAAVIRGIRDEMASVLMVLQIISDRLQHSKFSGMNYLKTQSLLLMLVPIAFYRTILEYYG